MCLNFGKRHDVRIFVMHVEYFVREFGLIERTFFDDGDIVAA